LPVFFEWKQVQADVKVPRQCGESLFSAVALTAVFSVGTAGKRGAAFKPAGATSSKMGGSSLISSFVGMSSSRRRSWKSAAICLHWALCPRSRQSTSWHALPQ
jgi:hypothetical protein